MIAWIPIAPVPWSVPPKLGVKDKRLKAFQNEVGWFIKSTIRHKRIVAGQAVKLSIIVLVHRPQRQRHPIPTNWDATNVQKAVEDAAKTILFDDDRFVCDIRTVKRFVKPTEVPGFWIQCRVMSVDEVDSFGPWIFEKEMA